MDECRERADPAARGQQMACIGTEVHDTNDTFGRRGRVSGTRKGREIEARQPQCDHGARPFPDARPKFYPQRERRAPSVAESRRAPSRFTEIVDACLSLEPSVRPSVAELADELDAVIGP